MNFATIPQQVVSNSKRLPALWVLVFCTHAFSQYHSNEAAMRFQHYSTKDGLSDNNASFMFQDSRGLIWIGTRSGLNYFDGKNFVALYPSELNHALYSDEIERIMEDSAGNILFRTVDGLVRFNWGAKTMELLPFSEGTSPESRLQDFFVDPQKNIWVLTGDAIYEYDKQFTKAKHWRLNGAASKKSGGFANYICFCDKLKNIWFINNGILNELDVTNNAINNSLINDKRHRKIFTLYKPQSVVQDTDGNFWLCTADSLYWFNAKTNDLAVINSQLRELHRLLLIGGGKLAITTWNVGFVIFDTKLKNHDLYVNNPSDPYSPVSNFPVNLLQDNNRNIWLSSDRGIDKSGALHQDFFVMNNFGLAVQRDGKRSSVSKPDLCRPVICRNKVFIATTDGGFEVNAENFHVQHYRADENFFNFTDYYCASFLLDSEQILAARFRGLVFFGANGKNLNPAAFKIPHPAALDSSSVVTIFKDSKKNVWMALADDNGIVRWDLHTNKFTHYGINEKGVQHFALRHFTAVDEDDQGNIMMGYDKGGLQVFNSRLQIFTSLPLPYTDRIYKEKIYSLVNDHHGYIWLGTSNGIFKYSPAKNIYQHFARHNGLASAGVDDLAFDNKGRLWAGTLSGVSCLHAADSSFTTYNRLDGLPEDEVTSLVFDSLTNRMYYTTIHAFGFFYPDSLNKTLLPLNPFITSFKITGRDVPLQAGETVFINPGENAISISYTTANFINPANTRYAYWLKGFDHNWVDAANMQYVDYTNLKGGDYYFILKASTDGINWFAMKHKIHIHVIVPFYKSIWFIVLMAVAFFGVLTIYLLISQRIKFDRLLAMQEIRNDIAGDLHDDVGSTLSSIMLMGELAQSQSSLAVKYLSQITESARKTIENMNDIVWAINPDNDTVEQMLLRMRVFAAALLEKKNIDFKFNTPVEIENLGLRMDERKNFYLIFKEAVHNAFKYAECKEVIVQLDYSDNTVTLKISDDGKGFDTEKKHLGNGLKNLQKRAAEIRGSLQVTSHPGQGTTILLVFNTTRKGRYLMLVKN